MGGDGLDGLSLLSPPTEGASDGLASTPFERMVRECKSLGITPLTEAEFAAEDRRIYTEMQRRRSGISGARNPGSPWPDDVDPITGMAYDRTKSKYNFGVYR